MLGSTPQAARDEAARTAAALAAATTPASAAVAPPRPPRAAGASTAAAAAAAGAAVPQRTSSAATAGSGAPAPPAPAARTGSGVLHVGPNNSAVRSVFEAAERGFDIDRDLDRGGVYETLLKHPVDAAFVLTLTQRLSNATMVKPVRALMSRLGATIAAGDATAETPMAHALMLAASLLRAVFARTYPDFNYAVINTLCGLKASEGFLRRLLVSVATVIAHPERTPAAKAAGVSVLLALACAHRTPTRNVFSDYFAMEAKVIMPALVRALSERPLRRTAGRDAACLLVLLALHRRGEARNPYNDGLRALFRVAGARARRTTSTGKLIVGLDGLEGDSASVLSGFGGGGGGGGAASVVDADVSQLTRLWGTPEQAAHVAAGTMGSLETLMRACVDAIRTSDSSSGLTIVLGSTADSAGVGAKPGPSAGAAAASVATTVGATVVSALSSALTTVWGWTGGTAPPAITHAASGAAAVMSRETVAEAAAKEAREASRALKPPLRLRLRSQAAVAMLCFYNCACKSAEGMRLAAAADTWRAHQGARPLPSSVPELVRHLLSLVSFALQVSDLPGLDRDGHPTAAVSASNGGGAAMGAGAGGGDGSGSGGSGSGSSGAYIATLALFVLQRIAEQGLIESVERATAAALPAPSGPSPAPSALSPGVLGAATGARGSRASLDGLGDGDGAHGVHGGEAVNDHMLVLLHSTTLDEHSPAVTLFKRASGGRVAVVSSERRRPPVAAVYRMVCHGIAVRLTNDMPVPVISRSLDVLMRLLVYWAHVYRQTVGAAVGTGALNSAAAVDHGDGEDRGVPLAVEWDYVMVTLLRVAKRVTLTTTAAAEEAERRRRGRAAATSSTEGTITASGSGSGAATGASSAASSASGRALALTDPRLLALSHKVAVLIDILLQNTQGAARIFAHYECVRQRATVVAWLDLFSGTPTAPKMAPRVAGAVSNTRAALTLVQDHISLTRGAMTQASVEAAVRKAAPWRHAPYRVRDWTADAYCPGFSFLASVGFHAHSHSADAGLGGGAASSGAGASAMDGDSIGDGDGAGVFHSVLRGLVEDVRFAMAMP